MTARLDYIRPINGVLKLTADHGRDRWMVRAVAEQGNRYLIQFNGKVRVPDGTVYYPRDEVWALKTCVTLEDEPQADYIIVDYRRHMADRWRWLEDDTFVSISLLTFPWDADGRAVAHD